MLNVFCHSQYSIETGFDARATALLIMSFGIDRPSTTHGIIRSINPFTILSLALEPYAANAISLVPGAPLNTTYSLFLFLRYRCSQVHVWCHFFKLLR